MSRIASIAFVALGFAAGAAAQKADVPDVKVGDRWQFVVWYTSPSIAPNRTWLVTSVNANTIEATENGEALLLTRELNVRESPGARNSNPQWLRFPLEVGKRWSYVNDWVFKPKNANGRIDATVSVIVYEKVSVPAGEFDAFKLEASEQVSGTSPVNSVYSGTIRRTYWYAPAAKAIVKQVNQNPYLGPSTIELVAMELKR